MNQAKKNKETAIFEISRYGTLASVKLLVEAGADINVTNDDGESGKNRLSDSTQLVFSLTHILQFYSMHVCLENYQLYSILWKKVLMSPLKIIQKKMCYFRQ